MDIETQIYSKLKFRVHTVTGTVSLESFCNGLKALQASQNYDPQLNAIWDISQASFQPILLSEVVTARDFVKELFNNNTASKVAVIVSSEINRALATMFAALFTVSRSEMHVYTDIRDALKWVARKAEASSSPRPLFSQVDHPHPESAVAAGTR